MTPDPYQASGGPNDPGSWNRYAYTRGDPVDRNDPAGLCTIDGTEYADGSSNCPDVNSVTVNGSTGQVVWWADPSAQGPPSGADGYAGVTPPWFQNGGSKSQYAQQLLAWQKCYKAVQEQQDQASQQVLDWLDSHYPQILGFGAGGGAIIGGFVGAPADLLTGPWASLLGAYLGVHIGALAANEFHTDAVLLFTVLSNLPPLPSSVAAACGPMPAN